MSNKILLIDFDGTLADSLSSLKDIFKEFTASYNIKNHEELFNEFNGVPLPEVLKTLKNRYNLEGRLEDITDNYWDQVTATYKKVRPEPYALELLEAAQNNGWRTAIVTSNKAIITEKWVRDNRLTKYINHITGCDSVKNGKPSPEPYLHALNVLNGGARISLALEDSVTGVVSATSAGLPTWLYTRHHENENTDKRIANMIDGKIKSLEQLIEQLK